MNKTELIAEVAKKCAMSKKDAEKAVSATFDTIAEVLCAGEVILRRKKPVMAPGEMEKVTINLGGVRGDLTVRLAEEA